MSWENDRAFLAGAKLVWPDDVRIAMAWGRAKGSAAARRRMIERYEGWQLLQKLAALQSACEAAANRLRGGLG